MIIAVEPCSDLVLPGWQPPRGRSGLVALVGRGASAGWADRLLARHGDGFVMWAAVGAQPAAQAMAVARQPGVQVVVLAPAAVDVRHAGLALGFAGDLVRERCCGAGGLVVSPVRPMLPEATVRVPHLVSVRHRGVVVDAVVWELLTREQAEHWLGGPLPDLHFFERHVAELLRLRAAIRAGRFPGTAAGGRLAELLYRSSLSIGLVYRHPELFRSLLVAQRAGRWP